MPLVKVRKSVPKKKAAPPVSAEVSRRIAKVRSRIPAERQAEDRAAAFKRIVQDEVRLEQARRAATSVLDSSLNEPVDVREAPAARSDRLRGPVRSASNHEQVLAAIARAAHAPAEQIHKGKSAGTQTANPGSSSSGTQTQARQMSSSGVQTDLIPERREDPTAAATLGYITGFAHRHALDRGRPRQRELAIVPFTPPAPPGPGVGQRLMDAAVAAEPYVRAAARGVASLGPPAARAIENGVVYAARAAAPGVAAAAQGTAAVITGAASAAQSLLPAVAHGSVEVGRAVLPVLAEGIAQGAAAIQGATASAARAAGRRAAELVQQVRDRSRSRPRLPDSEDDEPAPAPAPSIDEERAEWEQRGREAGLPDERLTDLPLGTLMRVVENAEDSTPEPEGSFPSGEHYDGLGRRLIYAELAARASAAGVKIHHTSKLYDSLLKKVEDKERRQARRSVPPSRSHRSEDQGMLDEHRTPRAPGATTHQNIDLSSQRSERQATRNSLSGFGKRRGRK